VAVAEQVSYEQAVEQLADLSRRLSDMSATLNSMGRCAKFRDERIMGRALGALLVAHEGVRCAAEVLEFTSAEMWGNDP
jgi:hypothetical protein